MPVPILMTFDVYPDSFWADLEVQADDLFITTADMLRPLVVSLSCLSKPTRVGNQFRIFIKSQGCNFLITEEDYITAFSATRAPSFKRSNDRIKKAISLTFGFVALVWILIWGASQIINKSAYYVITDKMEQSLGEQVQDKIYEQTKIDTARSRLVTQFKQLLQMPGRRQYDVVVVQSDNINAVTVPGNTMFIFSALLDRIASADELAALIGHEYGHVYHKHLRKSLARNMGTAVILSSLSRGASSIGSGLFTLNNLSHSRELEQEADLMSQEVLRINELNPQATILLLSQFKAEEAAIGGVVFEWLSDHPATQQRIELLQKTVFKNINTPPATKVVAENTKKLQQIWAQIQHKTTDNSQAQQ